MSEATKINDLNQQHPDLEVSVRDVFGIDSDMKVKGFAEPTEHVPDIDESYLFNPEVTLAILAGFQHNRRVLVQGYHGTGKSTHIEQVAARLNWPSVRVNLDGHITRLDLVGRDAIVLEDGQQVTEFREGILPWSLQRPMALVFDEFDAGRPDVMFVIQRILEQDGKFTLLDQNQVLSPHPSFRLFATANTIGLGNLEGLYHGTQLLNQAQIDRWSVVGKANGSEQVQSMVRLAGMTRSGFAAGDVSTLMSPRTTIHWAENTEIFGNLEIAFRMAYLNKCDPAEQSIVAEYFQRAFGHELAESISAQES